MTRDEAIALRIELITTMLHAADCVNKLIAGGWDVKCAWTIRFGEISSQQIYMPDVEIFKKDIL